MTVQKDGAVGKGPLGKSWSVRSNLGAEVRDASQVSPFVRLTRCVQSFEYETSLKRVECETLQIQFCDSNLCVRRTD